MVALKAEISFVAAGLAMLFAVSSVFGQQPRHAGLERNDEYMSLLREDAVMAGRIDSLSHEVDALRAILYEDDALRRERSGELLAMESDLYMLRGSRSRIAERINIIEQEWLMANLATVSAPVSEPEPEDEPAADRKQYADLIRNDYFARSLSRNDYAQLCRVQRDEVLAARLYSDFVRSHDELLSLRMQYDSIDSEPSADSLFAAMVSRQASCTALSDSLDMVWTHIFDTKSYLYDLLFDMEGREDMLSRAERNSFAMRQGVARESGRYASEPVVNYCFGKRCITDYESDIAASADLTLAGDSLKRLRNSLDGLRYDLDKVSLKRRCFVEYEPVVFSSRYVYSVNNPIPECPVWEYGTVCRIKLGAFSTQQPPAKFKGLEPVSFLRTANGGWVYYAGAYQSAEEMENAVKTVRRLGFTKADVAAWVDGVGADGREAVEELLSKRYSVEISGPDELSPRVREVIAVNDDNTGITRISRGQFTVGGLRSRAAAELLADMIAAADTALSVSVSDN
ncbi:MAG: hypothetical protein J1E04_02815 [Alistipes sp.]|nr:hypothetical protein [Alistipes sp.]